MKAKSFDKKFDEGKDVTAALDLDLSLIHISEPTRPY